MIYDPEMAHTIEYWKGQYEHASERIHDLECHALEIVEYARDQDARLKDLETAVSTPQPSAALTRLRTMFGLDSALDAEQVFVAVERYDAANLQTIDSLRDHVAMHAKLGQLAHKQAERWQEMAEDLWEELQEWHAENCGQADDGTPIGAPCTCHRILAAKWDEITNAADWAADVPADGDSPHGEVRVVPQDVADGDGPMKDAVDLLNDQIEYLKSLLADLLTDCENWGCAPNERYAEALR